MTQRFSINGISRGPDEILGIWRAAPTDGISFDVSNKEEKGGIFWFADLPGDPGQAADIIRRKKEALAARRSAIRDAGNNLLNKPGRFPDDISFAVDPDKTNLAEATLQYNLARIMGEEPDVSFGLFDWRPPSLRKIVAEFQSAMDQTLALLKPGLQIQTKIDQKPIAVSKVGLTGDLETILSNQTDTTRAALHMQTISLSLESRLALMQLLAQTGAGAAALAIKFSIPGGAVFAFPAAWRYIQDVMDQARTVKTLLKGS